MASFVAESLFWVAGASCAIAQVAIVRGIVVESVPDRAAASGADPNQLLAARPAHRAREAAWALLPGLFVALVLFWTWRTMHPAHPIAQPLAAPAIVAPGIGT
jgi:hypothetical protein